LQEIIKTPEREVVNDEAELYAEAELNADTEVRPVTEEKTQDQQHPLFAGKSPFEVARFLTLCGFIPIPLSGEDVIEYRARYQSDFYSPRSTPGATWAQLKRAFRKAKGVAIKCGKVSNLTVIDVDDPEKFDKFYPIDKLRQEAGYVVRSKTPGRYHFGFTYAEEIESIDLVDEAGFEIKSDNRIINFYSTIPGQKYTIKKFDGLGRMPEELEQKIKKLIASRKAKSTLPVTKYPERHARDPKELANRILDVLEPYYSRGQRHFFVLGTAGVFRIAGIPESVATDTLLAFCENMRDEEIPDRRRAIQDTYGKSKEEPITKFTYLRDALGVSDEHIEQIRDLIRRHREKEDTKTTEERIPVAKRALSLLEEQKLSFWISQFDETFVTISPTQHLKLENKDFKDYLQTLLYKTDGRTLHNQALEEVISICRQWARESNIRHHVHLRTGFDAERNFIEVNLGRLDGKILRITGSGYELDYPKLKFLRPKNLLPISFDPAVMVDKDTYTKEIVLDLFSKLFHLQSEEDFALLLAWMIKTFYPIGEYPILAILGEKEAVGKTTISKFIANLLDPTPSPLKTFPRSRDDLYSLAKNNFLLVFDNLSNISPDMSDALCQLSTGGSLSKRKLYTDGDSVDYPLKNPIVLNSIFNILHRRDLRRRCVVIELKKPTEIKSQRELDQIFREYAPHCYAYLVSCVQEALKNKVVDAPFLDLADFCEWIAKAHPVFFLDGRSFEETLRTNRDQTAIEILETNIVASFIVNKVEEEGAWETTASELLQQIKEQYPYEKDIPLTPEKMAREIRKIASDLEALGVKVDTTRTRDSRRIVFRKLEPARSKEKVEPAEPKKETESAKTKGESAPSKSQAVEELKRLLSIGLIAGASWNVSPEARKELIDRGLSVGRNGIHICKDENVAALRRKNNEIAPFYEIYTLDQILEAFPEAKEDAET